MSVLDVIIPLIIAVMYITPVIIADCLNHPKTLYIGVFNLLLGWTGVCWLIALVWACQDHPLTYKGD